MRTRTGQGRQVDSAAPPAQVSPRDQVDDIERDRRLERRLFAQFLLAVLFVAVLVVVGRMLTP